MEAMTFTNVMTLMRIETLLDHELRFLYSISIFYFSCMVVTLDWNLDFDLDSDGLGCIEYLFSNHFSHCINRSLLAYIDLGY